FPWLQRLPCAASAFGCASTRRAPGMALPNSSPRRRLQMISGRRRRHLCCGGGVRTLKALRCWTSRPVSWYSAPACCTSAARSWRASPSPWERRRAACSTMARSTRAALPAQTWRPKATHPGWRSNWRARKPTARTPVGSPWRSASARCWRRCTDHLRCASGALRAKRRAVSGLFVARDRLGRRSLLAAGGASGNLAVASVASNGWQELPVSGLFIFDLAARAVRQLPWRQPAPFGQPWWWADGAEAAEAAASFPALRFGELLAEAVRRRVTHVAGEGRVGLLFSGGLDSTVLAALAVEAMPGQILELVNVAFDPRAPDRLTALCSFEDLVRQYGAERFRLVLCDVSQAEVLGEEAALCRLLGPKATHLDFNIAAALWFAARGQGLPCTPAFTSQAWWPQAAQGKAQAALLLEPVRPPRPDEGPREKVTCGSCVLPAKPGCPHLRCKLCCRKLRQAAGEGEARDWCPVHKVKDVEGVAPELPEEEEEEMSARRVAGEAAETVLAACRVLLLGTGADELLGGYSRHRTARAKRGAEGTRSEMLKDLQRLWTRNLGRDDRIIADHGREARHPFLDDHLLDFIGRLPIELLAYGPGGAEDPAPDKWMLRQLASERHLHFCARFKKRAIQFGSRIAKQSNVQHAGSNRQVRGDMAYCALGEKRNGAATLLGSGAWTGMARLVQRLLTLEGMSSPPGGGLEVGRCFLKAAASSKQLTGMGNAPPPWHVQPGPPPGGYPPRPPPETWRGPFPGPPPSQPPPRKGSLRLERNEGGGVSVVVMQVPPSLNKMDVLNEYFGRFGPVSSLQINQMRHEAIVTFSRMEDAEEALRFPVLNDPSIGLRPWRAKAGQRAPDDVPTETAPMAHSLVVPSVPLVASGNMTLESGKILEAKRKREELQDRRKALLSSLTDQLKAVLARINDPATSDRNREQLQTILASIKDKIHSLTPAEREDPKRRMPPMRPMTYQTTLDNRPRPAVLQLSKLPEEMRGPDGEAQLRDALGDSVEWIREWSEDGSACTVRFRDRRHAEAAVRDQQVWTWSAKIQEVMPFRRKPPVNRFTQPRHMHKVFRPPRAAEPAAGSDTEAFDSDIEDPELLASMRLPDPEIEPQAELAAEVTEAPTLSAEVPKPAEPAEPLAPAEPAQPSTEPLAVPAEAEAAAPPEAEPTLPAAAEAPAEPMAEEPTEALAAPESAPAEAPAEVLQATEAPDTEAVPADPAEPEAAPAPAAVPPPPTAAAAPAPSAEAPPAEPEAPAKAPEAPKATESTTSKAKADAKAKAKAKSAKSKAKAKATAAK
ncbi:unnamed protein product, partial [Effrenium voratum]